MIARERLFAVGMLALVVGGVLACSSFGVVDAGPSDASTLPTGQSSDAAVDTANVSEAGTTSGTATSDPSSRCGGPVFCDDFEGATPLPRSWDRSYPTNNDGMDLLAGEGLDSSVALSITTSSKDTNDNQAFVRRNHGAPKGAWTYRLSFDANLVSTDGVIDGPRLLSSVGGDTGGRMDLYLVLAGGMIYFEELRTACGTGGINCAPNTLSNAKIKYLAGWHHYFIEVEVASKDLGNMVYGSVRLFMDGVRMLNEPLALPLASASDRSTLFGLSFTPDATTAELHLDNVAIELLE